MKLAYCQKGKCSQSCRWHGTIFPPAAIKIFMFTTVCGETNPLLSTIQLITGEVLSVMNQTDIKRLKSRYAWSRSDWQNFNITTYCWQNLAKAAWPTGCRTILQKIVILVLLGSASDTITHGRISREAPSHDWQDHNLENDFASTWNSHHTSATVIYQKSPDSMAVVLSTPHVSNNYLSKDSEVRRVKWILQQYSLLTSKKSKVCIMGHRKQQCTSVEKAAKPCDRFEDRRMNRFVCETKQHPDKSDALKMRPQYTLTRTRTNTLMPGN